MQPIIRWAGSKRKQVRLLSAYWPGGAARYVEPFCGSACLFFSLEPQEAVLGDANGELIGSYRAIQHDVEAVIYHLARLPIGEGHYYRIRESDRDSLSDVEAAARFIYLNRHCFNGIYRTDKSGNFNVPFGSGQTGKSVSAEDLRSAARLLERATLIYGDFEKTADWARPGDFVYLDPPYYVSKRRVFREYGPKLFEISDLERLVSILEALERRNISFLLSYADCKESRNSFKRWLMRRHPVYRHMAGFSGARGVSYELLVTNIEPEDRTHGH
jgi:DNA adenine methylase